MSELIDKDELMRKHTSSFAHDNKHNSEEELRFLLECISTAPIIKAQPVKRGKWQKRIKNRCTIFVCSECGLHFDYEFKFCPNCGADMRGGADDA